MSLTTPIRIIPIAKIYGFSVFQANMPDDESGYIIVSESVVPEYDCKKIIVFNANHSKQRNRFTVAHELAHYFFHMNETLYAHRDKGNISDIEERNANSFASALLMPKQYVMKIVNNIVDNYWGSVLSTALISTISEEFNVSEKAAEVRLRKLGIINGKE